jgi:hypothetical protein
MWTRLVLALLWLGFVASWVRVAQHTTLHEVLDALRLLLLLTLAYSLSLVVWVLHNQSIYRHKGPRRAVRETAVLPAHDYLGVPVEVRVDRLSESEIVVDLTEGIKYYLPQQAVSDLLPLAHATSRTGEAHASRQEVLRADS